MERKTVDVTVSFRARSDQMKQAESRMAEITELQKHISAYSKTREIYRQYKESGYSKKFKENHAADILLHQATKKYFDSLGYGKDRRLPTMNILKKEYATLRTEKNKLYQTYKVQLETMRALLTAKQNVDRLLGASPNHERSHHTKKKETR